jgi:TolB protein
MYDAGASPSSGIWTVNGDGTNKVLIYNTSFDNGDGLTWSKDGNKVAYSSRTRIYIVNSDGSNYQRLLVSYPKTIMHPDWSPDGSKLVFHSSWGGDDWKNDIYIMDLSAWDGVSSGPSSPDDSRITALTTDGNNYSPGHRFPTWSPDGSQIAFVAGSTLSIMNSDGSNVTSLNVSVGEGISWSPDGSKLLYATPQQGGANTQIRVINVDGSEDTDLSNNPTKQERHPVWSPDGTKIAFNYNQNLIYVMNADGSGKGPLNPQDHVYGKWPDWRP